MRRWRARGSAKFGTLGSSWMVRPTPWPPSSRMTWKPRRRTSRSTARPMSLVRLPGRAAARALSEGAFGAMGEFARFFLRGRDLDGDGGVGVVAVFHGGEIEFDEVAGLDGARAGNAVDDLVVDADADVAGKIVDERRRGLRAVFFKDVRGDRGEFSRGNPGTDAVGHGAESFGDDLAAGAKFLEFFWGVDRHGLQRSSNSRLRQERDDHEEQGSDDRVLVRFRSIP